MKRKLHFGIAALLCAISLSFGITVNATSDPFTFPAGLGVKDGKHALNSSYFGYTKLAPKSGIALFQWSLPSITKGEKGSIVIYTLLGRTVKTFSLASKSGSVTWKSTHGGLSGVYIAKFSYGSYKQNLKLIMSK